MLTLFAGLSIRVFLVALIVTVLKLSVFLRASFVTTRATDTINARETSTERFNRNKENNLEESVEKIDDGSEEQTNLLPYQ